MHSKLAVIALLAAAFAPTALAGTASVQNNCGRDIFLASIGNSPGDVVTLKAGDTHSEEYREGDNGGGVSIKISNNPDLSDVSQFEYTLDDPKVFYDLSNIDGKAFVQGGVSLTTTDPACPAVNCADGDQLCPEIYNKPDDDFATHGCDQNVNLNAVLCPGGAPPAKAKKSIGHPHARRQ